MITRAGVALAAITIFSGFSLFANAQKKSPKTLNPTANDQREAFSDIDLDTYVIGNTILMLYHELAHALIAGSGLPSLGGEENAADDFALVELIVQIHAADQDLEEQKRLKTYGFAFIDFWLKSSVERGAPVSDDYFGEHALDLQRHFNAACLLYGGSAEIFHEIAEVFSIETEILQRCKLLYFSAYDGWSYTLGQFGLLADEASNVENILIFEFSTPEREQHQRWWSLAKESDALTKLAEQFSRTFDISAPIKVRFEACEEENAYFDPASGNVIMCYEFMNAFSRYYGQDTSKAVMQRP